MDAPQSITMRALAALAGVNQSTVSRSLRNDSRIPETTRKRIRALAARHQYKPDPALAVLAAYRNKRRPASDRGKIAVWNFARPIRRVPLMMEKEFEGIQRRASELGYVAELFTVPATPADQRSFARVLDSQGIRGLIVGSVLEDGIKLDHFRWAKFCSVAISYSLQSPNLHFVVQDHDQRCQLVYRKLRQLGYRKIGYCTRTYSESSNRNLQIGAYFKCLYFDGMPLEDCPPLFYQKADDFDPIPWLERHRFDAVIACMPDELLGKLKGTRFRVPENLGVAGLGMAAEWPEAMHCSGGLQDFFQHGIAAVDLLHQLICHGDRGIPAKRQGILIEGSWQTGKTTRKQTRQKSLPSAK